jgi:maltokinase
VTVPDSPEMFGSPGATESATSPLLPDGFANWMSAQRWYGGKGSESVLTRAGGWTIEVDGVRMVTHYILDTAADRATLYQVPITERSAPLSSLDPIGRRAGLYCYDAPHDPDYPRAIVSMIIAEDGVDGDGVDNARGHRQPGTPTLVITESAVLRGEQSNTSIICQVLDGAPVILKVFRTLHHGDNPDVVLQSAIAASGSRLVPTSVGYLSGEWSDSGRPEGFARGDLAFAQEFLPGAEDAWRVALTAAVTGEDFSERARSLGQATADVHSTLAAVLPTREPSASDREQVIASMRRRLDLAIAEVPSLAELRPLIEKVFEAALTADWPALQRIHGDYHLGQVLDVPERGWVLVDFEGEPLRPMSERSELDMTLRDVAGMLRSFDYAAGSVALTSGGESPTEWAASARDGFLAGYVDRSEQDVHLLHRLLDAFEIDKALYEAVYEARNRPSWIPIPVAAISRLAHLAGNEEI